MKLPQDVMAREMVLQDVEVGETRDNNLSENVAIIGAGEMLVRDKAVDLLSPPVGYEEPY